MMVKVLEIPSCASLNGSLDTEDREATAPCVSRPCIRLAPGALSAIKYAKVEPIRDEDGIIVDFKTTGDFPKYGNDDDRVDEIAQEIVHKFMTAIRRHHTYRNGVPTTSILTITSNVTYGKATGNTPDGRKKGQPFAPGANPMHGRDTHGAVASLS